MATTRSTSAGNNYAFIAWYNENGDFLIGGSRTEPTAGNQNGNPAARIRGIKSASPTVGEPEPVPITGDDALLSEIDFPNVDTRRFTISVAVQDLVLASYMNDVNTFEVAESTFMALDTDDIDDRNAVIILQAKAEDEETGASAWSGVMALLCTTSFLGRETFEERSAGAFTFSVTPKRATYLPWGVTLANSVHGTERSRYTPFSGASPSHLQVFKGDGAETDFILKHDPVGLSKIAAFVDRVPVTIDSLDSGTNTITLNSAPGNGRLVQVLYQFDGYNE